MKPIAVIAHARKSFGGGLSELRELLDASGADVIWHEVDKSRQASKRVGRAIDDGVAAQSAEVWLWCGLLLAVAVVQAVSGALRHRMAVKNLVRASLHVGRLIGHHSAETGSAITATTPSGEIVATVSTDALSLGDQPKRRAIAIEAPRAACRHDLQRGLTVAVDKLVPEVTCRVLVGQFDDGRAEPLHIYDRDRTVGQDAVN